MTKLDKIYLLSILLLAFFLRIFNIDYNPPSLYGDELTLVYDAYSIFKTGHDQTGQFLPLTFSMSEGRPPVYVYFSVPFVAIFGPTALSVRLLSILSGLGIIYLIFLITKTILNEKIGLLAALLVAILPWDLSLSRGGFETHLALFLSLVGIYSFLVFKEKPRLLILGSLCFSLSLFTYHSYKVVIPIFIIILIWMTDFLKNLSLKKYYLSIIPSVLIFFLCFSFWISLLLNGSEIRFQNTNLFNNHDLNARITENINNQRYFSELPEQIKPIFYNKFLEYSRVIINNYFDHFSLTFLFLIGDQNPRHNILTMGELYLAQLILLFLGLAYLLKNIHVKLLLFLLFWILIAPLPTIIVSSAHALRSSFLMPPLIILSAAGLFFLFDLAKKYFLVKIVTFFLILCIFIQFIFVIEKIFFISPLKFGNFWSYPARQVSEEIIKEKSNFDYIIVSDQINDIEYAYPVYAKINPEIVIAQNKNKTMLDDYLFKKFSNVYIGYIPDEEAGNFITQLPGSVLYLSPLKVNTFLYNKQILFNSLTKK